MTDVPLREYLEQRFDEDRRYYDQRIHDVEDMIERTLDSLNHRLEAMNQLRDQMTKRENSYVTRVEHSEWGKRIDALERFQAKSLGGLGVILLLVPALNALITYIIIHR